MFRMSMSRRYVSLGRSAMICCAFTIRRARSCGSSPSPQNAKDERSSGTRLLRPVQVLGGDLGVDVARRLGRAVVQVDLCTCARVAELDGAVFRLRRRCPRPAPTVELHLNLERRVLELTPAHPGLAHDGEQLSQGGRVHLPTSRLGTRRLSQAGTLSPLARRLKRMIARTYVNRTDRNSRRPTARARTPFAAAVGAGCARRARRRRSASPPPALRASSRAACRAGAARAPAPRSGAPARCPSGPSR